MTLTDEERDLIALNLVTGIGPRLTAYMQEPTDLCQHASSKHIARGGDGFLLEIAPRAPVADLGGTVIDDRRALDCLPDRSRISQVAFDDFRSERTQKRLIAARPHEDAYRLPGGAQLFDDVAAELPGRARDEIDFVGHAGSRIRRKRLRDR